MNIRIDFPDSFVTEFVFTDEPVDNKLIWPNLTQAKEAALEIAIDNRNQWAACVREIRKTTLHDVQPEH